ncbi:MAG: ImmA/IrrE family metallo-endopeptidase [Melioribacteraceae bacterium]|nr:ImmA/IrrE family metallo-endopeptidase [Melioribacteraceae bacterium]
MKKREKSDLEIRAIVQANLLLNKYMIDSPTELDIAGIALMEKCIIKETELTGEAGRIIKSGDHFIISIKEGLEKGQRNFVTVHELGHRIFKETISTYSVCKESDLRENKIFKEALPNQFAAELMMKREWFLDFTNNRDLSFDLIKDTAEVFNTSIMSACIRYAHIGDKPVGFIYVHNEKIRWKAFSSDFPFWSLNSKLNELSYSKDYFRNRTRYEGKREIDIDAWFRNDRNRRDGATLYEEIFYMPRYGGVMVMLTT